MRRHRFGTIGMVAALLAAALGFAAGRAAAADDPTRAWWEGEAAKTDLPARSWLSPQSDRERDVLSGGEWLTHPEGPASAAWTIDVKGGGEAMLWVRGFRARFEWRIDGGPWRRAEPVGRAIQRLPLDISGSRYLSVGWQRLGAVDVSAGEHRFAIRTAADAKVMAIDCFALIEGEAKPHGKHPPGEKYARAPEGWFAFEPDRDGFEPSPIDLRRLNHKRAGVRGRLRRVGDGVRFEREVEPTRFWGVTATSGVWRMTEPEMDYLARRLAKTGVNMVRFHVAPYYETEPGELTKGVHYFASALKKQGIYCGYNWYCLATNKVQPDWGWEGFEPGERLQSLHLYYPPMQELYRAWAKTLFASTNPYTGRTLAEDPATAYIELIDEDNYLFWSFRPEGINPKALPYLEREFGAWAAAKYGSIDAALEAWGGGPKPAHGTDDAAAGRLAMYPAMAFGGADWQRGMRNEKRATDQLRFMVEDTRAFYTGMKRWLREEVGYDGLVVATNWKTVDERIVGPLDQYANTAVDITARNTYFRGPFKRTKFHPWMVGDPYRDRTLLRDPMAAITMHLQQAGYPHFITEGGYAMPNRFRTEEQLLMASYASLQGIDGLFPFVVEGDWSLTRAQWPIQTAATLGQYPAASLIYRLGYVTEGPVVMQEALKLDDLYAFKGAAVSQPLGLDDIRAMEVPEGMNPEVASLPSVDPLAFYVGRVAQRVGEDPGKSRLLADLPTYIDRKAKTVRSATGELTLDYGAGVLKINASHANGATGFLREAGRIALPDLTIDMQNEYGAVALVSLDGKPLAESGRMLLQVMTEEKDYNWRTEPAKVSFGKGQPETEAQRITNIGTAPLVVRKIAGAVALTRPDADKLTVTALDDNGYPSKKLGAADRIDLMPTTLYYLIAR